MKTCGFLSACGIFFETDKCKYEMEIFLMLPKMTIHQLMLDDLFLYCLGWEN
jgi:hypothetical protein